MLSKTKEKKKSWESAWKDREKALKQKILTCKIMIEKTKINRDINLLFNEIETHKNVNYITNDQIQNKINNFHIIAENMRVKLIFFQRIIHLLK